MSAATYFDERFQTMQGVQATEGIQAIAYDQQVALLESLIEPGSTVLDVGCGPALSYDSSRAWAIGLDPSAESLRANTDIDHPLVGSATNIPLPDDSVDMVVAFYALHHMTTRTFDGSRLRATWALVDMQRVLKPGGEMLVFEMAPHAWVWWLERAFWDFAKAMLGDRLDPLFLPPEFYCELGATVQTFRCSPFETFAPILALPWLRIPRFLYPFDAVCYRWSKPPCP